MDEVLARLDFAFRYHDNILIGSTSPVEHLLYTTFTWFYSSCSSTLLVLNMEKYESAQQEIVFLGHHITAERHHQS